MSLITEVSKQNERDGRLIISGILRVTCLAFPSPPPPSHSNPRSGPNRTAYSHSGRAKFARAMKVSKSGRKDQFAPEKKCRIWRCSNVTLIYILSDKNLKHVLRITLSVFERYESFLLTPDIFKPICSIESVKFQWPHAIQCNSPVSRVLVTKEPRLVNNITFPAHPGRPRGSQSGRDKRRSKSFQARAEEIPWIIFYRPVSPRSQPIWHLIGAEKLLCFSAQSGSRISYPPCLKTFVVLFSPDPRLGNSMCFYGCTGVGRCGASWGKKDGQFHLRVITEKLHCN